MKDVVIRKEALLEDLRRNRENHRTVFDAAVEGFRAEAIRRLNYRVRQLKAGKLPNIRIEMPVPQDHTKDYDRIIKMIEMHIGDEIEIDERTFQAYVMDDWAWKRQFMTVSNSYAAETVSQVYGDFEDEND